MLISSLSNPRIKQIRALRQRKVREATSLYFVEGIRIVTEAAQLDAGIETLVIAPELLKSAHALELVAAQRPAKLALSRSEGLQIGDRPDPNEWPDDRFAVEFGRAFVDLVAE